jgi:hypothetical protein
MQYFCCCAPFFLSFFFKDNEHFNFLNILISYSIEVVGHKQPEHALVQNISMINIKERESGKVVTFTI